MNFQALIGLVLVFISGTSHSVKFTFTNNCSFTVWPGTLTGGGGSQLSSTGFDLPTGASSSLDVRAPWSGRLWGRSQCSTDASGKFTCAAGDCGSGQLTCNGAGAIPPASLVELTLAPNGGLDFYDVSPVDGFNLPVMLAPQGGSGDCKSTSCAGNVNTVCPPELSVRRSDGIVISCKSACMALNRPEYCCTGAFGLPTTCPATNYSQIFKTKCPEAYSYAYDDQTSTFTCSGGPKYAITLSLRPRSTSARKPQ